MESFKRFVDKKKVDMCMDKVNEHLNQVGNFVFPAAGDYWLFDPRFSNGMVYAVGIDRWRDLVLVEQDS
jgi:hypothetical protein